jgi:hypothetical protein
MKYATFILGATILIAGVATARAEPFTCNLGTANVFVDVKKDKREITGFTLDANGYKDRMNLSIDITLNKYGAPSVSVNNKRCYVPE